MDNTCFVSDSRLSVSHELQCQEFLECHIKASQVVYKLTENVSLTET